MRRILVPIDGSPCSMRALDHAVSLAQALAQAGGPAELRLLNVHPDPIVYGEIQVYVPEQRMLELQRRHSETLLEPAAEKARNAGVAVATNIAHGDAAATIVRRAQDFACDGIVMGTRGMGSLGSLLLGSVAAKVVHLANVPVTLVK